LCTYFTSQRLKLHIIFIILIFLFSIFLFFYFSIFYLYLYLYFLVFSILVFISFIFLSTCNLLFIMEKIFHRSSRCYETSIDNTRLIFIRGIHTWTNTKMKEFIYSRCKKFILLVKRITKFNDVLLVMFIFPLRNTYYKSDMHFQKFSHGFRITH